MSHVLCLVAHPDDETLGCGGTLAKHAAAGDAVMVLYLSDGVGSRGDGGAHERREQFIAAGKILCLEQYEYRNFPDNQFDTVPILDLAREIETVIESFKPNIVYTHHGGDLNVDHQRVAEAVLIACRPKPGCTVKQILQFEVLSSTEWGPHWRRWFEPTHFVDITATLETKIKAFSCYLDEVCEFPHPRSVEGIRALAQVRGMAVGVPAAEAFVCARCIA